MSPDTEAEKQTGLNDCNKCKYSGECLLLIKMKKEALENSYKCLLGVK